MCCLDLNLTIKTWVVLDESFNLLVSGQKATWDTILVGQVSDSSLVPCLWGEWRTPQMLPLSLPLQAGQFWKEAAGSWVCCDLPIMPMSQSSPARESHMEPPVALGEWEWGMGWGKGFPHSFVCTYMQHCVSSCLIFSKDAIITFFL